MEKIILSNGVSFDPTDIVAATFYPKGSVLLGGVGGSAPELREVAVLHVALKDGRHVTSSGEAAESDADRIEAGHGRLSRAPTVTPPRPKAGE